MCEAHPRLTALGANQVTISGKSAAMAKSLQTTTPFPLWLDPEHALRQHLGIGTLSPSQMFGPTSLKNYAQSLGDIRHLAVRPSDANQTPSVVILDAEQKIVWQRVGKALGDYPSIDDVIENLPG